MPEPISNPGFYDILNELRAMHDKKSKDYGHGDDPLANLRASEKFGIPAWVGVLIRLNDKIVRVQSFLQKGSLANESLDDSLIDIPVYAVLALQLYREGKGTGPAKDPDKIQKEIIECLKRCNPVITGKETEDKQQSLGWETEAKKQRASEVININGHQLSEVSEGKYFCWGCKNIYNTQDITLLPDCKASLTT